MKVDTQEIMEKYKKTTVSFLLNYFYLRKNLMKNENNLINNFLNISISLILIMKVEFRLANFLSAD